MLDAHEVKEKLALVAKDKLSVNAFEDWLIPNSWNMHKNSSPEAIDLVSSIQLMISERNDSLLNRSEFRKRLVELFNSLPQDVVYAPVPVIQPSLVLQFGSRRSMLVEHTASL